MATMASTSRFSTTAVVSMFETDDFPEDGLSSESEEDELDLSDPDAGAYSNSEGEDTDGNTSESELRGNATEVGSSMDESSASEGDSVSSNKESPLSKRYVKLPSMFMDQ